jgi:branched-chain amino acid aminotransferase
MEVTMDGLTYVDGEYFRPDEAAIPILDAGFTIGLMVFDTIPVYQHHIFRLDAHLDRLFNSLKAIRFDGFRYTKAELSALVLNTVRRSGLADATVQVMVTRGRRQPGVAVNKWKPALLIQCIPQSLVVHESQWKNGVSACISTVRSLPPQCVPPQVKHVNRIINYLAGLDAQDRGADEAIFLDGEGMVTEGPNFNIFAVRGDDVLTPRDGVLRGVTRDTIMMIARHHGYAVIEQPLAPYDFFTADEVFITSTSRGAIGIVSIDGRTIGDGIPGPATRRLNDTYWSWRVASEYAVRIESGVPDPVVEPA